jgi:isopentenyl-diphosphate delta-isomerase
MSAQEIVQIFDPEGNVTGVMTREEAEAANHAISNALIFIFDTGGRVWVQLRPQNKKHFPGIWDISACGAIAHGETPAQAAAREQFEEMGFNCDLIFVEEFMQAFPLQGNTTVRKSYLFIGVSDEQPKSNEEVDEFRAFEYDQLRREVVTYPELYTPSFLLELDKAVAAYKARPGQ